MKNSRFDIYIIVLGGALKKTPTGWRTTNFQENGDLFGVAGDRLRVLAAAELYKSLASENVYIIASGGKGQLKHLNGPFLSCVLKKELVEAGIPLRAIVEESKSNNTYEQLKESSKVLKKRNNKNAILISNKYHFPRIKAFIESDKNLKNRLNKLQFKSAEEILIKANAKKWEQFLKKVYASHDMKIRIQSEQRGIKQIKNGTYDFTIGPKNLLIK